MCHKELRRKGGGDGKNETLFGARAASTVAARAPAFPVSRKKNALHGGRAYCYRGKAVLLQLSEVLDGANHLRSVRVLIVVPSNNLNERVAVANLADHGLVSVEQ